MHFRLQIIKHQYYIRTKYKLSNIEKFNRKYINHQIFIVFVWFFYALTFLPSDKTSKKRKRHFAFFETILFIGIVAVSDIQPRWNNTFDFNWNYWSKFVWHYVQKWTRRQSYQRNFDLIKVLNSLKIVNGALSQTVYSSIGSLIPGKVKPRQEFKTYWDLFKTKFCSLDCLL